MFFWIHDPVKNSKKIYDGNKTMNDSESPTPIDEDLEALCVKIADDLSSLSNASVLPSGVSVPFDPFDPHDVDYLSNGWVQKVLLVQHWLNLESSVPMSLLHSDPVRAVSLVFKGLSEGSNSGLCMDDGGHAKLLVVGAQTLASRLDIATRLQGEFAAELENDISRLVATRKWKEWWDEESPAEVSADPIHAKTNTWPIAQFVSFAGKGTLNLKPSYQRGDVWSTGESQMLIESVIRGIPLPSIIILKNSSGFYDVVDGKQRLTSILRFMGKHPTAIAHAKEAQKVALDRDGSEINFPKLLHEDYKEFKLLWKNYMGEKLTPKVEQSRYFPFKLQLKSKAFSALDLDALGGKYYSEVRGEKISIAGSEFEIEELFEGQATDYRLPLIEYTQATPKQIHEVFKLYNKQGKKLTAEEIRNAMYHEVVLARLLLMASGDHPFDADVLGIADVDPQSFSEISSALDDYDFGITRYRRTKVLSWVTALLMQSAVLGDEFKSRSTKAHIDALFESISVARDSHALGNAAMLRQLLGDLHRCINAHQSFDGWPGEFKDNDDGCKWHQLQLVASLVGTFLIGLVVDDTIATLEDHRKQVKEFCNNNSRPTSVQNNDQWKYIAKVALGLTEVVSISAEDIQAAMERRYGSSCIPTLTAALQDSD